MATLPRVKRKTFPASDPATHSTEARRPGGVGGPDRSHPPTRRFGLGLPFTRPVPRPGATRSRSRRGWSPRSLLGRGIVQSHKEDQAGGTDRDLGARPQGASRTSRPSTRVPFVLRSWMYQPSLRATIWAWVEPHERVVEQHVSALTPDDQRVSRVERDIETSVGRRDDLEEGARHQALQDSAFSRLAR